VQQAGNIELDTAEIWVQNALKLAYVHLSVEKVFWGYTPGPHCKWEGGKAKRRAGLEGMERTEWEGMKDEGEGKGIEGREDSEGWCFPN
jgi:hypothetical protein